jgi:RNA polymerase-binding transcription factor
MSDVIRARLEEEMRALLERHGRIAAHLHGEREQSADWTDLASDLEHDMVLEGLDGVARQQMAAIREAFDRLESGTYGVCDVCGDEIGERRLQAVPTTTLCIDCAARVA